MAPLILGHFPKLTSAFILWRRVFPINVPRPNPDLESIAWFLLWIYGSPKKFFTSSGKPGPSSQTLILVTLLLLSNFISTKDLLNFDAFPIKFLNPYVSSAFLLTVGSYLLFSDLIEKFLLEISLYELIISVSKSSSFTFSKN